MIKQAELLSKYDDKNLDYYLLDVRSSAEFSDGHIPGSVNIPLDQLESRLKEIPAGRMVITICAHGFRSGKAETFLRTKGFHAESLESGLAEWQGQIE